MWSVHGRICFVAEEAGATRVTGVDLMGETPEFRAEHERRGSRVAFVQGDLHDPATLERAGAHDVVWCSGVLYHAPNPIQTLERLRAVTGELLIVSTEALPELPWTRGAAVLLPGAGLTATGARTRARPAARRSASRRRTTPAAATRTGSGASPRARCAGCCASPASTPSASCGRRRSTSRSLPGLDDRLDVAVVGAAAAAEHVQRRQPLAQRPVALSQVRGIAGVQLLGGVELLVAHRRGVGADPPMRRSQWPSPVRTRSKWVGCAQLTMKVRAPRRAVRVDLLDRLAQRLAVREPPVGLDGERDTAGTPTAWAARRIPSASSA